MNKKTLTAIFLAILVGTLSYLQFGRGITVCNSINAKQGTQNELTLNIIANRLYIKDKQEFADKIIDRTRKNKLPKIKLSKPDSEVYIICVYKNNYTWSARKMWFKIIYRSDTNEIIIED